MATARTFAHTAFRPGLGPLWAVAALALSACQSTERNLRQVPVVVAPYQAVLAVAPFSNESGVTLASADILSVSDKIVAAVNETVGPDGSYGGGWRAVPVDRTLAAMRQLGISAIGSEEDARRLIRTIPVDGLVVGTLTEWGPYDPPRFGANILLIGDDQRLNRALDATGLYGKTGDGPEIDDEGAPEVVRPITDLVIELDAVNHRVREDVRTYAESHSDVTGGFDPPERYYLMVFDRYLDFVANQIVGGLVLRERQRASSGG